MKTAMIAVCAVLFLGCKKPGNNPAFHIINLSLPRTGTTSFAGIFENYRSTHEFMLSKTILMLLDYREGKITADELQTFLIERRHEANHRVDSASFFFLAPENVISTFPDARFFFSVRKCNSWVVSMVDNSVFTHKMLREGKVTSDTRFLDRYSNVFISNHDHATFHDLNKLRRDSRHIVGDLAKAWGVNTRRTLAAMEKIPPDRRLVILTENFSQSTDAFARLAGIPPGSLKTENLHMNKDRDYEMYRQLLGAESIDAACSAWQAQIDNQLKSYPRAN